MHSISTLTATLLALLIALTSYLVFTRSPATPDRFAAFSPPSPSPASDMSSPVSVLKRMPSYFISHGGPPTLFDTTSAPYKQWAKIGKEIKAFDPKGLVVVSAHWENDDTSSADVLINEVTQTPLIYDFYGFPPKFYEQKFDSVSSPWLVELTKKALVEGGVGVTGVKGRGRGLDHGAWVPFKVLFPSHTPADFPIVQVSLPGDSSAHSATKLGLALEKLRDEGVVVVASGQPVHSLRDYFSGNRDLTYGKAFISAISSLVASPTRLTDAPKILTSHPAYRKAHPTAEHLLPLFVAIGAGGQDAKGTEIWSQSDGALGWQFLRFD